MGKKIARFFGILIFLIVCFIISAIGIVGKKALALGVKEDISIRNGSKVDNIEKRMIGVVEKNKEEQENQNDEQTSAVQLASSMAEKVEIKTPETLVKVNNFDYFSDSVTGVTDKQYTVEELEAAIKERGATFGGTPGMPVEEYKEAMAREWIDCTQYGSEPEFIDFSLTKEYRYADLENILMNLSRYDGVYLYDIGISTEGRTLYALEIDKPSDVEKTIVILTGTIHARETAGTTYLFKEIIDLLQNENAENDEILKNLRIAAVLCVNPDGREGVAFDTKNFTYSDGQLWKAASNGTDLNRNFPGLSFSQIGKGNKKTSNISYSPDKIFYPGKYGGCNSEIKAMIKFLYHYIVIEKAPILIDYHQQGSIGYAGKPWDSVAHQKACQKLADEMFSMMNKGNSRRYIWIAEPDEYGLNGTGSTLTDYACSVAYGAKFSPAFGFCVYTDGVREYPLCEIPKMDNSPITFNIPNNNFRTMTFEIGSGRSYLGYSESTRKLLEEEYKNYHFDKVFYRMYEILCK
ncbi:MAG: hypothetical protein K6E85_15675 [Lachnospiraceae bacterium]|nr:hypothetical protein [Lachnospiraceae bacterium]